MAELKLNSTGIRQILKSPEMQRLVNDRASKVARASGEGYSTKEKPSPTRARALIFPETYEAKRDNSKRGTMLRNLGAAR